MNDDRKPEPRPTNPPRPTTRKPRAKTQGNILLEAFERFAVSRASFEAAKEAAFAAQQEMKSSQQGLAALGIYVSVQPPAAQAPLAADEPLDDEPTEYRIPAVGPTFIRPPNESEVAAIRREAGLAVDEATDAAELADANTKVMGSLLGTYLGKNITVGPDPVTGSRRGSPETRDNTGGPVEQKPVG